MDGVTALTSVFLLSPPPTHSSPAVPLRPSPTAHGPPIAQDVPPTPFTAAHASTPASVQAICSIQPPMAHFHSAAAPVVPSRDTKPLWAHTSTPDSAQPPFVSSSPTTPSAAGAGSLSSPTTIPLSSPTTGNILTTAHTPPPTPPLPSRPATAATLTPTRPVQAQELPSPPPSPVLPALKSSTSSRDTTLALAHDAAEHLDQGMLTPSAPGADIQAPAFSEDDEDEAVLAYCIAGPSSDRQTPIPPPIASHPLRDTYETVHTSTPAGSSAMPAMTFHAAHTPELGAIANAAGHEEPEGVPASNEVEDEARRARRVRRWLASQCRLSMLVGSGAEYDAGEYDDYDYDDEEEGDFEEGLYEKEGGRGGAGQLGSIAGGEKVRGEDRDDDAQDHEHDLRADSPLLGFSLVGPAQGQPQYAQRDLEKPLPTLPPPEVSVSPTSGSLAASARTTTTFNHFLNHHHLDPSPTVDSENTHLRPDTTSTTSTKETTTKMTGTGALRRPNTQTHSPASSGGYTPPVSAAPVDHDQSTQNSERVDVQSHTTVAPTLTSAKTRVRSQSASVQTLYNQNVLQEYRRDEKQEGEEGQRHEYTQPEPAMYHLPTAMRRSRSSSQMLLSPGMAPLQARAPLQTPAQVPAQTQAQTPTHAQYLANGPTPTLRSARSSLGPHHSFALGSGSGTGFGLGYGAGISSSSGAASVAGYTYAPRSSSLAASPMILSASPAMSRHLSLGPSPVGSHASLTPSPMTRHASLAPSVAPSIAPSPMLQSSPLPPMTRQASHAPSHAPSIAPSPVATRHTSLAPSPMLQASPLPPSAPPTRRSRAGSLSAAMSLSLSMAPVGETAAIGGRATGTDGPVQGHSSTGSIGAGMRDAVYIDSEDVKARLDELLAQAGEEREVELEKELERGMGLGMERAVGLGNGNGYGMGLGLEGVDERADALMGRDPVEEEEAANALCTPPPSALGVGFPPNVYTTPTNANAYSNQVGRVVVAPSSTSAPHSPGSAVSRPLLGHRSAQASQASLRSISTQSHPYMTQHASSSQVYLGPASAQTASSQPQSPAAYSPQQLLPAGSYSHSHSHSQAHSQTPSQAHSRAGSLASTGSQRRSQPRSSRIHSRAASREGMNGAPVSATSSPAPVHARLSRSPSALMNAQAQVHSRSHSRAGSGASPMTLSMSIPVPVQVRTEPAEKPTRPPPAPPLDLGVAGLGLGLTQGGAEETNGYGQVQEGGEEKPTYAEVDADAEVAGREEEEEEMSDEELERLQFLRGLRLEDRMEEFRGVDFPSGLDDGYAAGDAATDERAVEDEEGVLPEEHSDHEPEHEPEPTPAMMGSMSRWSIGSSVIDEPPEGEKKKKRKSFVAAFGGGGGGGGSTGGEAGDAQGAAANGPKKRGRLASFISRLSGVGAGGTVSSPGTTPSSPGVVPQSPANSGFPDANATGSDSYAIPPVPAVPTALMPSPAIVEAAVRRVKSHESIEGLEVAGSVQGAWDPYPSSKLSPTRLRNGPVSAGQRPTQAPPLMKAYSADVLGASPPFASTRKGPSRIVWQTELDDAERAERGETVAALGGLRARSNTLGDVTLLASRRPALYKSASASVLVPAAGQQRLPLGLARRAPGAIHTRIQYHGPPAVQDDGMPPTPSSIASTEIEEEDEEDDYGVEDHERSRLRREHEHEERWARLRANYADVDPRVHMLPTIPQSPPPPEPGVPTKVETMLQSLPPAPPVAPSVSAPLSSAEQRQRLKSMPSLVHIRSGPASPPASASTADFGGVNAPPVSARTSKSSVFRGFVERMGFAGSSANNSPMSSYPGTPLSPGSGQLPGVLGNASYDALAHYPSNGYGDSGMRSPSHSPTTSMAFKEGGVFAPGGLLGKKKPKKKLVISGVPPNNTPAFEAVKSWCESFGEVREMTRGQNGKLYVDFKKASVADMVCRVQAQVSIKGVGSVSLSWYTKSKPN